MIVWGGYGGSTTELDTGRGYTPGCDCPLLTWYRDADGDGYGATTSVVLSCTQPLGYVATGGDCNDSDARVWSKPLEVAGIEASKSTDPYVSWESEASTAGPSTLYDITRGRLSVLRANGFPGMADCASNDVTVTHYYEPLSFCSVPSGDGCWYLVRGQNSCGTGTYGPPLLDAVRICP